MDWDMEVWPIKNYYCPIKSIKYKKYRSAIVYSMVESYYVIPSSIKK